jgi:acetoacetyl-CoA synthetase
MDEIVEAMAVEQRVEAAPGGTQLVLLVVLREASERLPLNVVGRSLTCMHRAGTIAADPSAAKRERILDALANPASTDAIRDAIGRNGAAEHERPTGAVGSA